VHLGSGTSTAALANPRYRLDEPVYLDSPEDYSASVRTADQLRFTLHIDIDGTDPLNVVSGTVAVGPSLPGSEFPHFIGRVTSNRAVADGRLLTVRDFKFRWPDTAYTINQLKIRLNGSPLVRPTAQVTFRDTEQNRKFGPFTVTQESMYFREVEMDVDREINTVDVEPISTHVHPDRPADLPEENLTLESAFAKAGIRITRSRDRGTVIDTSEAGPNRRWNYSELHDSMRQHWEAFANKPQWKMWIFLAELADSDTLGGVMFDGEIDEPGGVDRQTVCYAGRIQACGEPASAVGAISDCYHSPRSYASRNSFDSRWRFSCRLVESFAGFDSRRTSARSALCGSRNCRCQNYKRVASFSASDFGRRLCVVAQPPTNL